MCSHAIAASSSNSESGVAIGGETEELSLGRIIEQLLTASGPEAVNSEPAHTAVSMPPKSGGIFLSRRSYAKERTAAVT